MFRKNSGWVIIWFTLCVLLCALSFSAVKSANTQSSEVSQPVKVNRSSITQHTDIVGVQYHGLWSDRSASDRSRILDKLAAAGVSWVRLDVAWAVLQPQAKGVFDLKWGVPYVDRVMAELKQRNFKVLVVFYWAPKWSSGTSDKNGVPSNAQDYADAASWLVKRYPATVKALEVWNEPDLEAFLKNRSVKTYTQLVKATYKQVKSVSPKVKVVAGAPTYVKTSWFKRFYQYGGAGHYDALGIHPYMGVANTKPSTCVEKYREYYPCNISRLSALMDANGDKSKKIWATEYGWSSHSNAGVTENWRFGVPLKTQASNLVAMQKYLKNFPKVQASFWYNDMDKNTGDVHKNGFGILNRDFSEKPIYWALKNLLKK